MMDRYDLEGLARQLLLIARQGDAQLADVRIDPRPIYHDPYDDRSYRHAREMHYTINIVARNGFAMASTPPAQALIADLARDVIPHGNSMTQTELAEQMMLWWGQRLELLQRGST